jgi:hypothetical protein
VNNTERGIAITLLLFAYLASVVFSASITTSMTRLMMAAGKQAALMSTLRRYLVDHNISPSLTVRMQRNAEHSLLEQRRNIPESSVELLRMISEPLLVELHYELRTPLISVHPFFDRFKEINSAGVGVMCHQATSVVHLSPGDVVFRDCETMTDLDARMYWCMQGRLKYTQTLAPPAHMEPGNWACEAVLWTTWMHCGTLQACSECNLLGLNSRKVRNVWGNTPFSQVRSYAQKFVKELNECDRQELTDLVMYSIVDHSMASAFPDHHENKLTGIDSTTSWHWKRKGSKSRQNRSVEDLHVPSNRSEERSSWFDWAQKPIRKTWVSRKSKVVRVATPDEPQPSETSSEDAVTYLGPQMEDDTEHGCIKIGPPPSPPLHTSGEIAWAEEISV